MTKAEEQAVMTPHPEVRERSDEIEKVVIETRASGVRIIDKTGPPNNPADPAMKIAPKNAARIQAIVADRAATEAAPVNDFVDLFAV